MSDKTKLGYVTLPAEYVFDRAITVLTDIEQKRQAKADEFIETVMQTPTKSRFFPKPAWTREEAIKAIKTTEDLDWYWWGLNPENRTEKQKALDKLIAVSQKLCSNSDYRLENTDMQLTIEVANWLV